MAHRRGSLAVLAVLIVSVAAGAAAQQLASAENPLQREYEYRIGSDLQPAVEVANVRWTKLRVEPREDKDLNEGEEIATTLTVELENLGSDKAEVLVIVLLEDAIGNQLARLEAGTVKVKGERAEVFSKKLKVDGGALGATRKIWVYLEVTR